jgi:hypothetical protein
MRIDSSGNVGIGTSAPKTRLQASAAGQKNAPTLGSATDAPFYLSNNDTGYGLVIGNSAADGRVWLQAQRTDGTATAYNLTLNEAGGNVGIGTSSPGQKLTVQGAQLTIPAAGWSSGQTAFNYLGDTNNGIKATNGGSTEVFSFNALTVATGATPTERMRIDSSGNVLVGTSTSFGKFSVFGTAGFNADADATIPGSGSYKFRGAAGATTITTYDYLNYTAMQFIRDNGNPTNTVGSITCTDGSTSYNTSSDYRLKNIDGPLLNSGAYIDALNPVEGWWKTNGSRFIGLLAHEVQEVSQTPVATGEKDGEEMQQMDYSAPELITNLIAEVQSLRARVAQLEGN